MPTGVEVRSELYLEDASKELLEWARTNINEDPDTKCQKIADFKDLIYSRGECTPHRVDDAFLLRFLRSRKFSLEAAHQLIVNYCNYREENPQLVQEVGFRLLDTVGNCDLIIVPPYRDQDGRRILVYKLGKWLPEIVSMDDILSATLLILELAVLEEQSQVKGGICIVDCSGITMQHALHLNHSVAYKIFQTAVTSHPMKLQEMHIINSSWMFESFLNLFKKFLSHRMLERLFIHGANTDGLHKYVDPKCLPQTFGGTQPDYDYKEWLNGFCRSQKVLKELKCQGYAVPYP